VAVAGVVEAWFDLENYYFLNFVAMVGAAEIQLDELVVERKVAAGVESCMPCSVAAAGAVGVEPLVWECREAGACFGHKQGVVSLGQSMGKPLL
jgi:hypothetical protein